MRHQQSRRPRQCAQSQEGEEEEGSENSFLPKKEKEGQEREREGLNSSAIAKIYNSVNYKLKSVNLFERWHLEYLGNVIYPSYSAKKIRPFWDQVLLCSPENSEPIVNHQVLMLLLFRSLPRTKKNFVNHFNSVHYILCKLNIISTYKHTLQNHHYVVLIFGISFAKLTLFIIV